MGLVNHQDIRFGEYPGIILHHTVDCQEGMVCHQHLGLRPSLAGHKVVAVPVIPALLSLAGICIGTNSVPYDGLPVGAVIFDIPRVRLHKPFKYILVVIGLRPHHPA